MYKTSYHLPAKHSPIRSTEHLFAVIDVTTEWFLPRVRPGVSFEMMRCGKGLLASGRETTEGALASMSSDVLAQITRENRREGTA